MSIDLKGTTPGLAVQEKLPDEVFNLKCRGPKCDSIQATQIKITGLKGQRTYRCIKCGHTWGLNVGGSFDF
jgi:hypothetical protein